MCQHKLEATESLSKREGMLIEDIITLSLELGMNFLLENKNDITCNCIRLQTQKKSKSATHAIRSKQTVDETKQR